MTAPGTRASLPAGVWVLGLVSMMMDVSSEMIHALLPVYLVSVLGVSALGVGFIEGVAEATAMIVKVFSGAISDAIGRRKPLVVIGYSLAAATKPIFPLASGLTAIIAARFIDRIGKGIRGAPRDALIADLTTEDSRGRAFGLRQTLDTLGAIAGPLLAMALMALTLDNFRLVFWIAVIPAVVAVALTLFAVKEPESRTVAAATARPRLQWRDITRFSLTFWAIVAVAAVMALARFSEAFLVLRAQNVGLAVAYVPLVMVVMNILYASLAFPIGALSDRIGRRGLLILGAALLIIAELVLALGPTIALTFAGVALWGVHLALTQSLFAALVAEVVPPELRATAFGLFNVASGIAMLAASVIAGALWDAYGAGATFAAGAGFAALALIGVMAVVPRDPPAEQS